MSDLPSLSHHPSLAGRSLLYWLGDRNRRRLLNALDREVVSVVGLRLADAERSRPTIQVALREHGLGVALDGEAWRNQLASDHPLRGHRWRALGYDVGNRQRQPDRRLASDAQRQDLVVPYLEGQIRASGTLLTSPGHFSREAVGVARRNDLALAADCAERVRRLGARRPRGNELARSLYATLMLDARSLSAEVIRWLVGAYTELLATPDGPDGVWLWVVNFTPSRVQFGRVRELALQLQKNTAKPVAMGGLGGLWAAGLTNWRRYAAGLVGQRLRCCHRRRSQLATTRTSCVGVRTSFIVPSCTALGSPRLVPNASASRFVVSAVAAVTMSRMRLPQANASACYTMPGKRCGSPVSLQLTALRRPAPHWTSAFPESTGGA